MCYDVIFIQKQLSGLRGTCSLSLISLASFVPWYVTWSRNSLVLIGRDQNDQERVSILSIFAISRIDL